MFCLSPSFLLFNFLDYGTLQLLIETSLLFQEHVKTSEAAAAAAKQDMEKLRTHLYNLVECMAKAPPETEVGKFREGHIVFTTYVNKAQKAHAAAAAAAARKEEEEGEAKAKQQQQQQKQKSTGTPYMGQMYAAPRHPHPSSMGSMPVVAGSWFFCEAV